MKSRVQGSGFKVQGFRIYVPYILFVFFTLNPKKGIDIYEVFRTIYFVRNN